MSKITIDCVADLHGFKPNLLGGDLLLLAGDYTANDTMNQWAEFFVWLQKQQYSKKILIAGNHDGFFNSGFPKTQEEADTLKEVQEFLIENEGMSEDDYDFEYLCDSGTEYAGFKIWGTPWTPWFKGVHPRCKYFMKSEEEIGEKFKQIPADIDILLTHGPMRNVLDTILDGNDCGSTTLRDEIHRVKPKLHIFGHIHEEGGMNFGYRKHGASTMCINCSYVDEFYEPRNKICRINVTSRATK